MHDDVLTVYFIRLHLKEQDYVPCTPNTTRDDIEKVDDKVPNAPVNPILSTGTAMRLSRVAYAT